MLELKEQASAMAWDWDADDIDPNDDDGRLWVPMMAQTLKMGMAKGPRPFPPAAPAVVPPTHLTPPWHMTVYTVQPNQDGSAEQASMPVVIPVLIPRMQGQVISKANQGRGASLREEEMTTDEVRAREVSEASEAPMPKQRQMKAKGKPLTTRQAWVPKGAKVIISADARTMPCD